MPSRMLASCRNHTINRAYLQVRKIVSAHEKRALHIFVNSTVSIIHTVFQNCLKRRNLLAVERGLFLVFRRPLHFSMLKIWKLLAIINEIIWNRIPYSNLRRNDFIESSLYCLIDEVLSNLKYEHKMRKKFSNFVVLIWISEVIVQFMVVEEIENKCYLLGVR